MGDHGKTPSYGWRNEGILPGFSGCRMSRRLQVHDHVQGCSLVQAIEAFHDNWLQVFKRANPAHLCSGHTPERETGPLPSEKCAARCGSEYDEIRMSTVRF